MGELLVSRVSSTLFYKALEEQYQGVKQVFITITSKKIYEL